MDNITYTLAESILPLGILEYFDITGVSNTATQLMITLSEKLSILHPV